MVYTYVYVEHAGDVSIREETGRKQKNCVRNTYFSGTHGRRVYTYFTRLPSCIFTLYFSVAHTPLGNKSFFHITFDVVRTTFAAATFFPFCAEKNIYNMGRKLQVIYFGNALLIATLLSLRKIYARYLLKMVIIMYIFCSAFR